MYPYLRTLFHLQRGKAKPPLEHPFQESILNMRVWPLDIDIFMELNNGRYLTLMDIGRFEVGTRIGLFKILKENNWGLMVGGVSSRYRYRLRPFQKFKLHTRLIYVSDRWFYFHQSFRRGNKMHASCLVRTAVTSKDGIVPTAFVAEKMNIPDALFDKHNQPLEWIETWEASDDIHKKVMEEDLLF
ncbi:MAG: acyl-CoA thioesterase [Saprospiraceae bacterium]|nr:acyl-CoA thioesterase [Saprospiraceae bacterium]